MTDSPRPVAKKEPKDGKSILAEIFENLPSDTPTEVKLPSGCKFYPGGGPVTVRPLKYEDEKAAALSRVKGRHVLNFILNRCTEGIEIPDLLTIDKMVLMLKLREISFGSELIMDTECPSCEGETKITFDLSKLPIKELPPDAEDPQPIMLPILKKEMVIKRPRVKDEEYLGSETAAFQNLWRFIESVHGHTSAAIIQQVLERLPSKDARLIIKTLSGSNAGIDTTVNFECGGCGHKSIVEVPITEDFFTGN